MLATLLYTIRILLVWFGTRGGAVVVPEVNNSGKLL